MDNAAGPQGLRPKNPSIDMLIAGTAAKALLLPGQECWTEHEYCCDDIDCDATPGIQDVSLELFKRFGF